MVTNFISRPQFHTGQRVHFIGGRGTIRTHKYESSGWTYLIDMDMGPMPEMGRIGSETTIQLFETDLDTV